MKVSAPENHTARAGSADVSSAKLATGELTGFRFHSTSSERTVFIRASRSLRTRASALPAASPH